MVQQSRKVYRPRPAARQFKNGIDVVSIVAVVIEPEGVVVDISAEVPQTCLQIPRAAGNGRELSLAGKIRVNDRHCCRAQRERIESNASLKHSGKDSGVADGLRT